MLGISVSNVRVGGYRKTIGAIASFIWGTATAKNWGDSTTEIWGFVDPNDIDPEATVIYNRIIADGGVSNITRLNYFVVGLKTIYGTLANVPVCYDAHWIGYKLGSGTGATAGQSVAKLYTISVIQSVSDSDAQAFIYRVYNAGGELTNTEASAVNQLVLDMKSAGIWTSMKAVYPMVGASAATCAQNLISASFTGDFFGGWSYSNNGILTNGTNTSMNTNFNPVTQSLAQNSTHFSIYSRTNILSSQAMIGNGYGGGNNQSNLFAYNPIYVRINSLSTGTNIPNTGVLGFLVCSRISNLYTTFYKNNSIYTDLNLSNGVNNKNYSLGNIINENTYDSNQYAFASIGDGLTDTQASNFYTAVQAFQTTLSRQV